ncbi:MAG: rplY [Geobacteraceae bacterium]|jgi:large subunit ribosomal protein L25|nr:rplY [Geobacteraceae bacterium]
MEQVVLNIELRDKTGKGICRRLRNKGMVPAVVYGKGIDPVAVAVSHKELGLAIAGEGGRNHLITLKGDNSLDGNVVIVSDLLKDCLKGTLLHVDLHKINLEEKVKVSVAVSLAGTAAGVKEGGMLDFVMHAIEIECLPTQIPEHLDVDVTNLKIGESLHVGDLKLPAGIKVLDDAKATVVSILGKSREEAAETSAAEE